VNWYVARSIDVLATYNSYAFVEGKTHIDLYDQTEGTMPKLVEFFRKHLVGKK
jgi:hypothetical protein